MKKIILSFLLTLVAGYGFSQFSPTIAIVPASSIICTGQCGSLSALSGSTVITGYTWTPSSPNVTINPNVNAPVPNLCSNVPGTYQVTLTATSGSGTGTAVVQFTVQATPTLTATNSTTLLCPGYGATLTAAGATNYTWMPGGATTNPIVVSPSVTTTYTVFGNTGACTGATVITVNVNPSGLAVGISATGPTSICPGGTNTLTATGATTYTWSPPNYLSGITGSVVIVTSPSACITYSVVGETGTCAGSSSITICPGVDLNVQVSPNTGVTCIGAPGLTLSASGATNYNWAPSTGLSNNFGPIVICTPSANTCYTVIGSQGTCTGVTVACFTITPPPNFTVTPTNTAICVNSCYNYTASGLSTYTWSPAFTLSNSTGSVVSACPLTTTSYTVVGQSSAGCLALGRVVTLTVVPLPTATVAPVTNTVCVAAPGTTTLGVNTSVPPFGFAYSYTWTAPNPTVNILGSPNLQTIIGAPTYTAYGSTTTVFTVFVSYSNLTGCVSKGDTVTLVSINCEKPTATINTVLKNDTICAKGCITFSATPLGGAPVELNWYFYGGKPDVDTVNGSAGWFSTSCFPVPGDYTVALAVKNPYGYDSIIKKNIVHVVDTPNTQANINKDTCIKIGSKIDMWATQAKWYKWAAVPFTSGLTSTNTQSTSSSPTVTTTYIVTGYNSTKCKYNDTIRVCVLLDCGDMFVPNAFSPNNDGKNDVLYVRGKCLVNMTFQVFDRWGEKVFETNDPTIGWDGKYKEQLMNTGIFVYRLEGTTFDSQPFSRKGNVTLIR